MAEWKIGSRPSQVAVTGKVWASLRAYTRVTISLLSELENTSFCLIITFFWNILTHDCYFTLKSSETPSNYPHLHMPIFGKTYTMGRRK